MSIGISVVLAIVLWVVLQRLMKPIKELSRAVSDMQNGKYESRVIVRGNDDIAQLGDDFNGMADTIVASMNKSKEDVKQKQEFIDNFAHELKSPLTSIYGFAEYIQKTNISQDEQVECLKFIMDESSRLKNMSYTLLDMANMRHNSNKVEMKLFDIFDLKNNVDNILKPEALQNGVTLEWHISGKQIYGNQILLESMVSNFVSNSISAISAKSETIKQGRVNLYVSEKEIEVEDNGCGMNEEQLQHITEPFYRVDKARSRRNGNAGLGLSLCKQIVDVHGGSIRIESKQGVGTKVYVFLKS